MNSNQALSKLPTPTQTPFQMVDSSGNNAILVDSSGVNIFAGQDASSTIYLEKKNGIGSLLSSFQLDAVGDILGRTDLFQLVANTGGATIFAVDVSGAAVSLGAGVAQLNFGTGATAGVIKGGGVTIKSGAGSPILNIDTASGTLRINNTQVVAARDTGWTAWTGTAAKGTFDTATATLVNCAQTLKAVTDVLRTHGLIGT